MTWLETLKARLPEFEGVAKTNWVEAALWFNSWDYNNNSDMTGAEMRFLHTEWGKVLQTHMPEKYRTGTHLIGPREAYCGEDVYVRNGVLCWTFLSLQHIPCGTHSLIHATEEGIFCTRCDRPAPKTEIKDP